MNKLFLILSIFCFSFNSFSQKRGVTINFGSGFSKPDLRYEFLIGHFGVNSIENAKNNKYFADIDYFLNISKNFRVLKKVVFDVGLGYSLLISKPVLPVSNKYFSVQEEIFITSRRYYNHKIQLPIELRYNIIDKEKFKFGICIYNLFNISLFKQINKSSNKIAITDNLTKQEFKPYAIETFSGLFTQTKRLQYSLDYRFFNGKFKDDAIANNGLAFDKYNPFKIRFSVGYRL